jgi:hypothetical protein
MKAIAAVQSSSDEIAKILKMAFWDRNISPSRWLRVLSQGEPERNVVISSFTYLPVRWLVHQLGEVVFVKRWPMLREVLVAERDPLTAQRLEAWDALWGILAVGDSQYPVRQDIAQMGSKKRELLKAIVHHGSVSPYDLARTTGRDYSRIYKDVCSLVESKLVSLQKKRTAQNRMINMLQPEHSVNRHLCCSNGNCKPP